MDPEVTARDPSNLQHFSTQVQSLLQKNADLFDPPTKLPPSRPEDVKIDIIPGSRTLKPHGISRMNEQENELLRSTLARLLERGQIQVSNSEYGSRILFIKKPDGGLRLCVDYRDINSITRRNQCPIPNIGDLRGQVKGAKWFTKMDCRDGYYNNRMHPDSIKYTAFKCRFGLFEYTVMPFGLTNAPAIFSQMMNRIFSDLFDISIIVYLDDIVIFSDTEEEHVRHVQQVLNRLKENEIHLKLSKCEFFKQQVDFCGHTISGKGIKVASDKVAAIQSRPVIKSRQDAQKFLGVVVWFQDFIKDYAKITQPLTDLLRKSVDFNMGLEQ